MTYLGTETRGSVTWVVWTCDGAPLLAAGMVAAKGTRCGRRLELRADVLADVQRQHRRAEPFQVAQIAVDRDWQFLEALGYADGAGKVFCPDHRLAWDDEAAGRPLKSTLREQLTAGLEDAVAAAYKRLGLER